MDSKTLSAVMGGSVSQARYDALCPAFNACLIQANCTTVNRAAMLAAQVGHESVGLKYMHEIASGAAYEGRRDLGNTQPGDGRRFRGHGPLQITGRGNHLAVSKWAHSKGYVPTSTYFVDNPNELAGDRYGFMGVVWYWTVARARLNSYADAGDILAATRAINGGTNGLADRTRRWKAALTFGTRLLPDASEEDELTPEQARKLDELHDRICRLEKAWPGGVTDDKDTPYDLRLLANRQNVEQRQTWIAVQELTAKVDTLTQKLG